MTLVRLKFAVPEAAGQQPSAGALRWTPTKRRTAGDWVVMPAGFTVALVNGEATVEVDPTGADWVWRVDENVPSSQGGSRYVAVPDLAEIEYRALVAVDPSTLEPSEDPDPAWYAYVDTLEGQAATASASAVAAKVAAEAAQVSATGSETSAAASAATATTKATEASTSATNAATSATTALGHKDAAAESAGAAASSQVAAANSATSASNSATAAANSDTHATSMADIAQSSASDTIAAANGFSIGTVTTGAPGDPATATITGTAPDKKLNLGLPKGETGPANSLTVLETTTGPETAGATGPQGVKGDKGDPGGITLGTDLAANDLNNIVTSGVYRQDNSSGADSQLVNNYPYAGGYGVLYVNVTNGTDVIQTFYPQSYAAGRDARMIYMRNRSNNVWSPWRTFNSTRVDQAAGRAIYQWDDLNQREQLVYGDTGRRNITTSFPSPVAGAVYLSRSGLYANLIFADYQDGSANGTLSIPAGTIPAGFRPQNWLYQPAPSARLLVIKADGGLTMNSHSSVVWQGAYTWRTEDAWPTTLPGTAVGTIPNL